MRGKRTPAFLVLWTLAVLVVSGSATARAQPPIQTPIQTPAQEPLTVVAVPGEPFGVARVRIPAPTPAPLADEAASPVLVTDPEGRVFYPVVRDIVTVTRSGPPLVEIPPGRGIGGGRFLGRIRNVIRTATSKEIEQTVGKEVWFLFRGAEPFTVNIGYGGVGAVPIRPQPAAAEGTRRSVIGPDAHRAAIEQWWAAYTAAAEENIRYGDYPPLVESYLVAMLAGRLNMELPEALVPPPESGDESIASTLEMVAGTEAMRDRVLREVAQGDTERRSVADKPVPPAPQWVASPPPPPAGGPPVEIEPLATRVPASAFYLRFGSFKNYLWFRELGDEHGGDVTRMVTLRGFDYRTAKRTEDQLSLKPTELARMLGDSVIEDMAFVGHDLFLTEGPSLGVLMRARNEFLLGTSLRNDRATMLRNTPGATLREVMIDGQPASLLSTPDNRIRSFLINDGEYFFVSTSETLVKEFLQTGAGGVALADTDGFKYARELMPGKNDYAIFAYFSEGFFQRLVSPQYQIELRRRLYATADIALVQLAQIAARGEGVPATEVDQLVDAGFLPAGLGQRPDGSGPIVAGNRVIDSRRGQRGSFLPITDVELEGVTAEEANWYVRRADFYSRNWQQMDPLVAGIQRLPSPGGGIERLQIHAEVAPLVPEKYGWIARQLGPPTTVAIQFAPDDIVGIQAHVLSDQLGGSIPPHHLFAALKDHLLPSPAELEGFFDRYLALKSLAGYIGAWPQPGLIDRLPLGIGQGRPVGPGMTRLIGGLYRYQGGGFSIVSFMPDVITASLPYLKVAEAVEPAQLRMHVDNLQGTQLESWVNQQMYERSYRTSVAGAELLNSLTAQLKVDQADASEVASHLLDADLQCPLGGQYILVNQGNSARWISTAWELAPRPGIMPEDYTAPVLIWFRGLSARVTQYDARLVADALLDMEGPSSNLPTTDTEPIDTIPVPAEPAASGRRGSL